MPGRITVRARGRTRKQPGTMNKLETRYAELLEQKKQLGLIFDWRFECLAFRLAKGCTYNPDFMVITFDGMVEIHETKGFWEEDARVKIKAAAEMFPWFRFVGVQFKKGEWLIEEFEPR